MEALFCNNAIKTRINFNQLVEEIICYIKEKPANDYLITVGTDSPGVQNTFFVSAVTILRVGNGGRYFWTKSERILCKSLQERIHKEAMLSIMLVQEIKSRLKDKLDEEFFWDDKIKVHVDVGRNGPTKDFIDGVIGMIKGYGFEAVTKPDAYCASVVADRHT